VSALLWQAARPGAPHFRVLLVVWLGWLTSFSALMSLIWLSPLYEAEFQLDDHHVKWIKAVALGASGAGGFLLGLLADRYGRKTALLVSLILTYSGMALLEAVWAPGGLPLAAAVLGFGMGGQWASGQMLLGETTPPAYRRLFAAVAQSGAPLGLIASALFSMELANALGWRESIRWQAGAALLVPLAYFLLPESDLWARARAGGRALRVPLRALLRGPLGRRFALAFLLTLFCQANYWCTVSWLPEFMAGSWKLEIAKSVTWVVVFGLSSLVGYLAYAGVARVLGHRPAFVIFCLIMAAGVAMLTVFSEPIRERPGLVLVFAAAAGLGTGLWSSFGPLYAEVFPTAVRVTAAGACMNLSRGVNFFAPVLVRDVGGDTLESGVALAAAFALAAALTVWALPAQAGRPLEESGTPA
jgi:MFS family permease